LALAAVRSTLIWAYLELGDLDRAKEMLEPHMVRVEEVGNLGTLPLDLWLLVMIATREARWEDAESALEKGLALARSLPFPYFEGRILTAYSQLHVKKGELRLARETLEAALNIFRRLGAHPDLERVEQERTALDQSADLAP
jgi:tetratricopeptide (TPR) repeat protein